MSKLKRLSRLVGAAGVEPGERPGAQRLGIVFEVPMLVAALWVLLSWWSKRGSDPATADIYDLILWSMFVTETVLLSIAVRDTANYLKANWLNLVIIALGFPVLLGWPSYFGAFRLLRLVIIIALLTHVGSRLRKMLSRNELGPTMLATTIVILLAGLMMAALDPAIDSPWDGLWWAWVTISTVGYGDVVPTSPVGRALASIIILFGIGLFAMLTASFTAFFIREDEEKIISAEQAGHRRLTDIEHRLDTLNKKIDQLLDRENTTRSE